MKKGISILLLGMMVIPCIAQTEGYNADKTSYTTTLQHTPYSSESKKTVYVVPAEEVYYAPEPASTSAKFQCDIDLSGEIRGGEVRYNVPTTGNIRTTGGIADGGVCLDVDLGVRIGNITFIGGGLGIHSNFLNGTIIDRDGAGVFRVPVKAQDWRMPIYFKTRLYIPASETISPFFETCIGGWVRLKDEMRFDLGEINMTDEIYRSNAHGGFYFQFGFGCEFNRFTTAIGYRLYSNTTDGRFSYGYLSVGVRI